MIVRAALAALVCLAARVAGQAKQCDLTDENGVAIELTFPEHVLDNNDARGARSVLLADLNGDGDVDVAAAMSDPNAAMFRWYRSKHASPGNITFRAATLQTTPQAAWSIHAADVDGDGDVDLLMSQGTSSGASYIQWQPPARHSPPPPPPPRPRRPRPRPARGDARRAGTRTTAGRRPSPTPRCCMILRAE